MPQTFTAFGVFLHISAGSLWYIHHDLKSEVIITPSVFAPTAMFSGCDNSLMPIKVLFYPLALIISSHQRRATKSCFEIRPKTDLAADCKYPISVLKQNKSKLFLLIPQKVFFLDLCSGNTRQERKDVCQAFNVTIGVVLFGQSHELFTVLLEWKGKEPQLLFDLFLSKTLVTDRHI